MATRQMIQTSAEDDSVFEAARAALIAKGLNPIQQDTVNQWKGTKDENTLTKAALIMLSSAYHGTTTPGYPQYDSQGYTLDNLERVTRVSWESRASGKGSADRNRYIAAKGYFAGFPGWHDASYLANNCKGIEIRQAGGFVFALIATQTHERIPMSFTVYKSTIGAMRQKGQEIMSDLQKLMDQKNPKGLNLAAIKAYLGPELEAIRAKLEALEAGQQTMGEQTQQTAQTVKHISGNVNAIHQQAQASTTALLAIAENIGKAKPAPVQTTASKPAPPAQPAAKAAPKDNGAANLDGIGQQTGQAIQATFDPAKHFKPSLAVTSLDDYRAKADALATSKGITTDQAIRSIWRTVADQEKNGKGKPLYMVAPRFLGDLSAYLTGSASPAQQTVTSKPKGKPANAPKQGDMTTATDHPATVTVDSMVNKLNVDKARFLDLVNSVREIGGANLDQEDLATCARELASMGANVHDLKTRLAMKAALAWLKTL